MDLSPELGLKQHKDSNSGHPAAEPGGLTTKEVSEIFCD